jgi:hypothetical protein
MQGVTGLDIGPLTFGELAHAYKACLDFTRVPHSHLMALIANVNRSGKRRASKPEDFYRPQLRQQKRGTRLTVAKLHSLKSLFKARG